MTRAKGATGTFPRPVLFHRGHPGTGRRGPFVPSAYNIVLVRRIGNALETRKCYCSKSRSCLLVLARQCGCVPRLAPCISATPPCEGAASVEGLEIKGTTVRTACRPLQAAQWKNSFLIYLRGRNRSARAYYARRVSRYSIFEASRACRHPR